MTSTNASPMHASYLNASLLLKKGRKIFLLLLSVLSISSLTYAQQCTFVSKIIASSVMVPMAGHTDGTLAIEVVDGVGPFTYTVHDMQMNVIQPPTVVATAPFVVKNLAPGYYWIDIVDSRGCKSFVDGDLQTMPCTFVSKYSNVVVPKPGFSNGSFTVTVVDGTAPFHVTVYDGAMNLIPGYENLTFNSSPFTISGLPNKYYWVGIVDSKGCYSFVDVDLQCYTNCTPTKICTYTQGYYGNPGGQNSHTKLIDAILTANGGSVMVGRPGHSVKAITSQQILDFLPGGGPSKVLAAINGTLGTAPYTGTSTNTLLSQTLTLTLNLGISGTQLGGISLSGLVSPAVISAVVAAGYPNTAAGLLSFANDALAGGNLHGVTLSAISDAATAINEYFDECRLYAGPQAIVAVSPKSDGEKDQNAEAKIGITVSASPNPFQSTLHFVIESKVSGSAELGLYNLSGAKVAVPFSGYISAGRSQTVDYTVPSTLRGGLMYMMRVGDKMTSGKLVSASH
ncbi:hypothetical protein [Flavisolibacter nicotianae]|uniref:hypothetical protein n=1 Tax=Flavisolibacter nicotianae TaxID=2364882 RepID=UPI0013C53118|nr:hypothetical protein [Flavisolibacter nicotianae]